MERGSGSSNMGLIIGIIIAIIVLAVGIGVGIWLYEKYKYKPVVTPPSSKTYKGIWSKFVDTYDQGQTQPDAPAVCTSNNSQLATKAQLDAAYKTQPWDFCRGGWMNDAENSSGYYMKTLNEKDCGNTATGFIPMYPGTNGKLGVYCYGDPPADLDTGKDLWIPDY